MSVTTVIDTVVTYVGSITDIGSNHVYKGMPQGNQAPGEFGDDAQYPLALISAPLKFGYDRRGMGVAAKGFVMYDAVITVYLGDGALTQEEAIERATPLVDRFRAKFEPDWTMGGVCFNCEMGLPADNLFDFPTRGEPPVVQWTLRIQEERQANAAAA